MKRKVCLFIALIGMWGCGAAQTAHEADDRETSLKHLDEVVAAHQQYTAQREARISALRASLRQAKSPEDRYQAYSDMFAEYSTYQLDSAVRYALLRLDEARIMSAQTQVMDAKFDLINELIRIGMYKESRDSLASMDRRSLEGDHLIHYWFANNSLYEAMRYFTIFEDQRQSYRQIACAYKDSLIEAGRDNVYIRADRMFADREYEKGLQLLMHQYEGLDPDSRDIGPTAYAISDYYRRLGWQDEEARWLTISAESDIKCAVKEYISLRRLAIILYERGDVKRAYNYMLRSLEDAQFCNARLRTIEVSQTLPILNKAYLDRIQSERLMLSVALISIVGLILILLAMLMNLRRRGRRLIQIQNELRSMNDQSKQTNRLLSETSSIKNTYITRLLMECVAHIDKMDQYRRILNRKAQAGDMKGVARDLKSSVTIEEEWRNFYNMFDRTFLQLFPSYIGKFNALLPPEERISIQQDFRLTTELRIFALIRLGISDTERIAELLHYSKSTIYAYRSRTRLKSLDPEHFEEHILQIPSI